MSVVKCVKCGKTPEELAEYKCMAEVEGYDSATDFVTDCEGTYNPDNNLFCCTNCYVKIGMPLGMAIPSWGNH